VLGISGSPFDEGRLDMAERQKNAQWLVALATVLVATASVVWSQTIKPSAAAGPTGTITLRVASAQDSPPSPPFHDEAIARGDAVADYEWLINADNVGDPTFDAANCLPLRAQDAATPDAGTGSIDACQWPSVHAIAGNSPVVTKGDELELNLTDGIELPNGKYLISVTGPGFKIDGAHFTVSGADQEVVVEMNPLPLPTVTVRVNVFADIASTNGQFDGVTEQGVANSPTDVSGFVAHLNDVAGEVTVDVYGNPLCTEYEQDAAGRTLYDGDGAPIPAVFSDGGASGGQLAGSRSLCVTGPDGQVAIPNLGPNRYAVNVTAPDPTTHAERSQSRWVQTTTLEGGHDWDTWNAEGMTGYDTERVVGGESTPWVDFGFVRQMDQLNNGAVTGKITGRVVIGRTYVPQANGAANNGGIWGAGSGTTFDGPIEDAWVALACLAGCPALATDQEIYVQPANPDGTFQINNVPDGTYLLTIWDEAQSYLLDPVQVNVRNGGTTDIGAYPLVSWFTDLEGTIFVDRNGNGRRDGVGTPNVEPGVPNFPVVLKTRANTLQDQGGNASNSDEEGHWSINQAYPLTKFLILEAYHSAYRTTGVTWREDNESADHTFLTEQVDFNVLNILGLHGRLDIGVQPYAPNENGGIAGSVSYDVTRNEVNPREAATEDWQPGVPELTVQLWTARKSAGGNWTTESDGSLAQFGAGGCRRPVGEHGTTATGGCLPLQSTVTERWERPVGCVARDVKGSPAIQSAMPDVTETSPCLEAPMSGVQFGETGSVDGNFGFGDLTAGDYLVEVVNPTDGTVAALNGRDPKGLYEFTNEESINVFDGDSYVSQDGWAHDGSPASPPTLQVDTTNEPLENPATSSPGTNAACGGALHTVDVALAGNDNYLASGGSIYEGRARHECDVKIVRVVPRRSVAPMFHVYTEVPIPTRFMGYIIDDLNVSTDPKQLTFGEKAGVSNVPIGIYDYAGRNVHVAESDYNGYYEVLLPSTDTINCPTPSGVCPNVYRLVGNDPGQQGSPNPQYDPQYRTVSTFFQGWAGVVHPVDQAPTRIGVSIQFPGSTNGAPPACAVAATQPQLYAVDRPYVRPAGSRTITITGASFGATQGTGAVTLDRSPLPVTSWNDTTIVVTIPAMLPGPKVLAISNSSGLTTTNGLTFHVLGVGYNPPLVEVGPGKAFDPNDDPADGSGPRAIQRALESVAATPRAIVVVYPNTAARYATYNPDRAYYENVVLHSRVKLQGIGSGGPGVPGSVIDGQYYWTSGVEDGAYSTWWRGFVNGLPRAGFQTVPEGQVVYVAPPTNTLFNLAFRTAIDGFAVVGGNQQGMPLNLDFLGGNPNGEPRGPVEAQGGGIFVNSYARGFQISNNVMRSNGGSYGGAVRIGTPEIGDQNNDDVRIVHNRIYANGGTNFAGAIGIFNGADRYEVSRNDVCGNSSGEYGGAISHYGRSVNGRIDHNRIWFNQAYDEGGGVMIAGELPASTLQLSAGAGRTIVSHNVILGNVSNDDGGGLRFLMAAGPTNDRMDVFDNVIANNVATHEGGGIALDDSPNVRIVNNTIVKNLTTATAMTSDGLAAPAGLSTGANSALLQAALNQRHGPANSPKFSNPVVLDNVFADNRAGTWTANGVMGIGVGGAADVFLWDMGTADGIGAISAKGNVVMSPASSPGYHGGTGYTADPSNQLVASVAELGFVHPVDLGVAVYPWRTFPGFKPAAIVSVDLPLNELSDYHISSVRPATPEAIIDRGLLTMTQAPYGVTSAPTADLDDGPRPTGAGVDRGADEQPLPVAPSAVLDNFNRFNATNLGPNWTYALASPPAGIAANTAQGQRVGTASWRPAAPLGPNQEAGFTMSRSPTGVTSVGLVLKASGFAGGMPARFVEVRYAAGTVDVRTSQSFGIFFATHGSFPMTLAAGDQFRARALSTGDVEVYRNNVLVASVPLDPVEFPETLATGGGAIGIREGATSAPVPGPASTAWARIDDFLGGSL
jgi:IPT/TIG domain